MIILLLSIHQEMDRVANQIAAFPIAYYMPKRIGIKKICEFEHLFQRLILYKLLYGWAVLL